MKWVLFAWALFTMQFRLLDAIVYSVCCGDWLPIHHLILDCIVNISGTMYVRAPGWCFVAFGLLMDISIFSLIKHYTRGKDNRPDAIDSGC